MSGLTPDETAEPYSRDQTLRRKRGQGKLIFPVQLTTSRFGNLTRLMPSLLKVMTTYTQHKQIHTQTGGKAEEGKITVLATNPQIPKLITKLIYPKHTIPPPM